MSLIASLATAALLAASPPLEVQNNSRDFAIDQLYITESGDDWGPNLLSSAMVEPGETFLVGNLPPGIYDVRLVDDTGASCELNQIDFAEDPTFEFTGSDCYSN